MIDEYYKEAILIRLVEENLLSLFIQGKLNGTIHTCVGQEFSAIAFCSKLKNDKDFIFSNHRCHGHYISFTKDWKGLIAELMGKKRGVVGGVGSSQHLQNGNFFSNGIQGGIVPVAAGLALSKKIKNENSIGVVFIGDGTLGEGSVYETMNIISKWEIPLLIVCENNFYAQSTPQSLTLAGDILKRAEAFSIKTFHDSIWKLEKLFKNVEKSIKYVRNNKKPAFHLVDVYRLNPHSKGDDYRDKNEIDEFAKKDPLNKFKHQFPEKFNEYYEKIDKMIKDYIIEVEKEDEMLLDEYIDFNEELSEIKWEELQEIPERQVKLINRFFDKKLKEDKKTILIGEDILSPYGGAFKVTQDLSDKYPDQIFATPISELAFTGIANGLALGGMKPYVEIMFGDFITLPFDQILNHASKFFHMYNKKVTCPVVIRTPMGGGRGYGPTHSQSLEKFLVGIDNIITIALNSFIDPQIIYENIHKEQHPVIVIEHKLDYGRRICSKNIKNYIFQKSNHLYPIVKISPKNIEPELTIVTYGGISSLVVDCINDIFFEFEILPEVFILTKIHPLEIEPVIRSVENTEKLLIIEEGSSFANVGSEIVAIISEKINNFKAKRVGAYPVPIAAAKSLENEILPNKKRILNKIEELIE